MAHDRTDKRARDAILNWNFYRSMYIVDAPGRPRLYEALAVDEVALLARAKVQEICAGLSVGLKRALGNGNEYQGNNFSMEFATHHIDIVIAIFSRYFTACGMDAMSMLSCRLRRFSRNMPTHVWPTWLRTWPLINVPHTRRDKYGATICILPKPARLSVRRLQLDDCDHSQCPRCLWDDDDGPAPSISRFI